MKRIASLLALISGCIPNQHATTASVQPAHTAAIVTALLVIATVVFVRSIPRT